jgi:hypothetical protein
MGFGLIDMGNSSPGPLPSLVVNYPPNLLLCPSATRDTFYSLSSIYIIYILHRFGSQPYDIFTIYVANLGFENKDVNRGVQVGAKTIFVSPPRGDSGAAPLKRNIGKNCLVKYCNFVINLERSL